MTRTDRGSLQPGDVLLFRRPDAAWSWDFVQADPALRRKYPLAAFEATISLHDLIAELDGCAFTHAAIVIEQGTDPLIGNSDQDDLRLARLSEIEWEYGAHQVTVRRAKDPAPNLVDQLVSEARALTITPSGAPAYPNLDLLPAGHLLSLRNRPLQLPFLDDDENRVLNLALRFAADTGTARALARWRVLQAGHPHGYMCAAYVARAFEQAGWPLKPAVRPLPGLGRVTLDHEVLETVRGVFGHIHGAAPRPPGQHIVTWVRDQIAATLDRDQRFIREDDGWTDWLPIAPSPGQVGLEDVCLDQLVTDCAAVADAPMVALLATAYDLEHSDQLETVGECRWG